MDENTDMYYAKTFRDIKMFNAFKTRSVFGNQMCTMFIYFPGTAFVFVSVPCVGVFNIFAHKVFGRKYFCRKSSNMVHNIFSPCVNIFTHGLEYISHMAKPSSVLSVQAWFRGQNFMPHPDVRSDRSGLRIFDDKSVFAILT